MICCVGWSHPDLKSCLKGVETAKPIKSTQSNGTRGIRGHSRQQHQPSGDKAREDNRTYTVSGSHVPLPLLRMVVTLRFVCLFVCMRAEYGSGWVGLFHFSLSVPHQPFGRPIGMGMGSGSDRIGSDRTSWERVTLNSFIRYHINRVHDRLALRRIASHFHPIALVSYEVASHWADRSSSRPMA